MLFLLMWVVLSVVVGIVASSRQHNGFGWFALSLALSPLVALIILLIVGEGGPVCPRCAEHVKQEALVCKHCGYKFPGREHQITASDTRRERKYLPPQWQNTPNSGPGGHAR